MYAKAVKNFVIAGHGSLETVKSMLVANPALLNTAHEWRPNDDETALQAAFHVGYCEIAICLLKRGAPLLITTVAMLGQVAALVSDLISRGARGGASMALNIAVDIGNLEVVRVLLT